MINFLNLFLQKQIKIRLLYLIIRPFPKKNSGVIGSFTEDGRLKGFFCSKTVFNLSKKILTEAEIKVLENGLDFAPIQKTLNETETLDFEEFSRRMKCKWNFRNKPSNNFSQIPAFRPKSGWKPPKVHLKYMLVWKCF